MKLTVITINNPDDYSQWETADGDYISFVPAETRLEDKHFFDLVKVYEDRPLYRKISMVAPVVSIPAKDIYSWTITDNSFEPADISRSREPYAVQIAYLPGAIIKKKALQRIKPTFTGDIMQDSINLSTALWTSGLRCFVDPATAVESDDNTLANSYMYTHNEEYRTLQDMFQREYIR